MTYTDFEDEAPCIHHRSAFDTLPAPPPSDYERGLKRMREPDFSASCDGIEFLSGRGILPADMAERVYASALAFPGGEVELPKPTRAELVLSAQQWAVAVRESFVDGWLPEYPRAGSNMLGKLDRLDAVLKELADHG